MFVSGPCKIGKTTFCAKVHSLFQEQLRAPETALGPVHFEGFLSVTQRRDSERVGLDVQTLVHVDNGMLAMVLGTG